MKKLILLFTILCIGQLYGMEAQHISELPGELQKIIIKKALAQSNNLDKTINMIGKLSTLYGIQYNIKDFTQLVHILADKFNTSTEHIAQEFNTPIAQKYLDLGRKLYNLKVIRYSPLFVNRVTQLMKDGADINFNTISGHSQEAYIDNGVVKLGDTIDSLLKEAIFQLDVEKIKFLFELKAKPIYQIYQERLLKSLSSLRQAHQRQKESESEIDIIEQLLKEAMEK